MSKRWHGAAFGVVGIAALLAAYLLYAQRGYHTPTAAGVVPTVARPSATEAAGARPTRIVVTSIDVDAPVISVGVRNGALAVPDDPQVLGWWSHGARAGASAGSVVVVGHVDSWKSGAGALFRLESVPIGARVTVETGARSVHYRIVGRRVYAKRSLPSSVFAVHGAPRLVLITCGGPFDRATRHYADNVVVYGVPVSA